MRARYIPRNTAHRYFGHSGRCGASRRREPPPKADSVAANGQQALCGTADSLTVAEPVVSVQKPGEGLATAAVPGRTKAWYDKEVTDQTAAKGSPDATIDHMSSEYPSTRDSRLSRLIDAWPALPESLRAGILAMIDSARK